MDSLIRAFSACPFGRGAGSRSVLLWLGGLTFALCVLLRSTVWRRLQQLFSCFPAFMQSHQQCWDQPCIEVEYSHLLHIFIFSYHISRLQFWCVCSWGMLQSEVLAFKNTSWTFEQCHVPRVYVHSFCARFGIQENAKCVAPQQSKRSLGVLQQRSAGFRVFRGWNCGDGKPRICVFVRFACLSI